MKLSIFAALALLVVPAVQIAEAQPRVVCGHNGCPHGERRGDHRDDHRRGASILGGSVVLDLRIGPSVRHGRTIVVAPPPRRTILCKVQPVFDYRLSRYVSQEVCREVWR